MTDHKVFTLEELAEYTHSQLKGNKAHLITNVADLETAGPEDASFLANPKYEMAMRRSQAGAIFVAPNIDLHDARNYLINENPSWAFQKTIEAFFGTSQEFTGFTGIHPTAVIHESAVLGKDVTVGPHVVIDKNVTVGKGTFIAAGSYLGPFVTVGDECKIHPNVTIRERCKIGNRVILQPNVVVGGCGFGYITDAKGRHTKLNQVGIVIIEDDVEIGAGTTIDRSRFKATKIGRGTKIDNLVMIGHGVVIGEDNLIVAQTGIAGSSKTGRNVVLGGQVAVAGHVEIADMVMVAACSGISKTITKSGKYGGVPVMPLADYNKNAVYLRSIDKYLDKIKELEERLDKIDNAKK